MAPSNISEAEIQALSRPDDEHDPMVDVDHRQLFSSLGVPGVLAVFTALRRATSNHGIERQQQVIGMSAQLRCVVVSISLAADFCATATPEVS